MKKVIIAFVITTSCSPVTIQHQSEARKLLAKSDNDQTSIWDTNSDNNPDIQRWYRGSGIVYEKIDIDFDGFWDIQAQIFNNGNRHIDINYPHKKYSVENHFEFYPTNRMHGIVIEARH
jgi:hypothetical protein